MSTAPSGRVKIGIYSLGSRKIQLFANRQVAGSASFSTTPNITEIEVGCKGPWHQTVGIYVHEAMELALADLQARFVPDLDSSCGSDGYMFCANHNQFSQAAARVGELLANSLPDLSKAHGRKHR